MTKRPAKYAVPREPVVQPQDQSIRYIPLTRGQIAIVDASDYDWLMQWNWIAIWNECTQSFYANRTHGGKSMHLIIMGVPRGVDHKNRNTLDNRRENLRIATRSQQCINRGRFRNNKSGHPGVFWHVTRKYWVAYICMNGKQKELGRFADKDSAIAKRKEAEAEYFGEFSPSAH